MSESSSIQRRAAERGSRLALALLLTVWAGNAAGEPLARLDRAEPIVTARAQRIWDARRETRDGLAAADSIVVELTIQNRGEMRVLLRPSEITLTSPDGTVLRPLLPSPAPGPESGAERERSRRISPGLAVASLPLLFVSMVTSAAIGSRRNAPPCSTPRRGEELRDVVLRKNCPVRGTLHFAAPAQLPRTGDLVLALTVIDLETESTNTVRLPVAPQALAKPEHWRTTR